MTSPGADLKTAAHRSPSWWQTCRAVAWSFLGIRQARAYEEDVQRLNPVHVVIAGIVGALLFILTLVAVVRWVIVSGVAAG